MGKSIFGLQKKLAKQERKRDEEFLKRVDVIKKAFLQFQLDNDCRCAIVNELQAHGDYPPNILVDSIVNATKISWRPMTPEDKEMLIKVIAKKEADLSNNGDQPTQPGEEA